MFIHQVYLSSQADIRTVAITIEPVTVLKLLSVAMVTGFPVYNEESVNIFSWARELMKT